MKNKPEKEVYKLRRSLLPLLIQFITRIIPIGIIHWLIDLGNRLSGQALYSNHRIIVWVFTVFACLILLERIRIYFNDLYIFGHTRIIHFSGCFSFNMRKTSIYYSDIKEVYLKQSLFARFAHYGTLKFGTAGTDSLEIVFKDIPLPKRLARYVQEFISSLRTCDDPDKINMLFHRLVHAGCVATSHHH